MLGFRHDISDPRLVIGQLPRVRGLLSLGGPQDGPQDSGGGLPQWGAEARSGAVTAWATQLARQSWDSKPASTSKHPNHINSAKRGCAQLKTCQSREEPQKHQSGVI